jgi:hypothetical protein
MNGRMGIGFVDFAGLSPPVRWRSSLFDEVVAVTKLMRLDNETIGVSAILPAQTHQMRGIVELGRARERMGCQPR